jgi:hypothetical protein
MIIPAASPCDNVCCFRIMSSKRWEPDYFHHLCLLVDILTFSTQHRSGLVYPETSLVFAVQNSSERALIVFTLKYPAIGHCWVWGSHDGDYEDYSLLGCNPMYLEIARLHLQFRRVSQAKNQRTHEATRFLAWLNLRSWGWWYLSPKRRALAELHYLTTQKTVAYSSFTHCFPHFVTYSKIHLKESSRDKKTNFFSQFKE